MFNTLWALGRLTTLDKCPQGKSYHGSLRHCVQKKLLALLFGTLPLAIHFSVTALDGVEFANQKSELIKSTVYVYNALGIGSGVHGPHCWQGDYKGVKTAEIIYAKAKLF